MRARGCLIGLAVAGTLLAVVAGVFGPGLLSRAREFYIPISRLRSAQREFEAWERSRGWTEPAEPALSAAELDRFLALRKELRHLEDNPAFPRRTPRGQRPNLNEIQKAVQGASGFVSERFAAFQRADMPTAQYQYLDRLIYRRWLTALRTEGKDPLVLGEASREVLTAAEAEANRDVAARLRVVAQQIRQRTPAAPEGVPPAVHELLLRHATEIEALAGSGSRLPGPPE